MSKKLFPITGIGSLPHPHFDSALKHILKYDIPFAPQLPVRNAKETMIYQSLDGIGDLSLETGGIVTVSNLFTSKEQHFEQDQQSYHCLTPLLFEIQRENLQKVKIQFTGAYTLFEYSKYSQKDIKYFLAISHFIIEKIKRTLAQYHSVELFLQIDEPALFSLKGQAEKKIFSSFMNQLLQLKSSNVHIGIHCCSNAHWGELLKHPLDFISIDTELSLDTILNYSEQLYTLSNIFLGVIPTLPSVEIKSFDIDSASKELLFKIQTSFEKRKISEFLKKIVLTPACGLGQKKISECEDYLGALKKYQQCLTLASDKICQL